jgi:ABC-2 type transport system ATP-binding protein
LIAPSIPELRLTARRYLIYMGELSILWGADNRRRVDAVLARVDLTAAANARIATYSKGMTQRLGIAQAAAR